jgi:hypothetical protein
MTKNLLNAVAQLLTLAAVAWLPSRLAYAQAVPATPALATIIDTYYQRLEATYAYQPAALPPSVRAVRRYLRIKNKKYLLEYVVQDATQQLQESFFFKQINNDTLLVLKEKYLFGSQSLKDRGMNSSEIFTQYLGEWRLKAGHLLLRQQFNPLADLVGAKTGVALYATDVAYETLGDTVACYYVQAPGTGQTAYRVELRERQPPLRPWSASQVCQTWLVDQVTKTVSSTRAAPTTGGSLTWTRIYTTATDFSETLVALYPSNLGGGSLVRDVRYKRVFRQQTAHQATDSYEIPNSGEKGSSTVFELISYYE